MDKKTQDESTYKSIRGNPDIIGGIGGGMRGVRIPVGSRGSIGVGVGSGAVGGRGPIAGIGGRFRFAKGGSASSRADGCARRGKTKGKFV